MSATRRSRAGALGRCRAKDATTMAEGSPKPTRKRKQPTEPPPACYGSGYVAVLLRPNAGAFEWRRVSPRTCYFCHAEVLCLQQQRTRRRR